jgi:hypothetical protein
MRTFIGRDQELAAFRSALSDPAPALPVIFLHGPGGIGKSTLLVRFADEARQHDRPVVLCRPGTDVDGSRDGEGAVIVLVDDLDLGAGAEDWLRDALLPAHPPGTLFVVASRQPPSVTWRTELGWADFLRPMALEPLSAGESTAILSAHDVPEQWHGSALAVGCGNPLALRVAAQTIRTDPRCVTDADLHRSVALSAFDQLIGAVPSQAHRQALDVCAHAATTDESLLRAGVPGADPAELFTWLRGLPFVSSAARGLFPTEVVRTLVEAELRWRDADAFAAMHERVKHHLIARARAVSPEKVLPFIADVLFVQRSDTLARPVDPRMDQLAVQEHAYQPADLPEVRELALRAEGARSADIAEFWLGRQPQNFYVHRRPGAPEIVAFAGQVQLTNPSAEELNTDPVAAAAWTRTQRITPLRTGEHVTISRFTVDPAAYHRPGSTTTLSQLRLAAAIICDDHMAWQVIACPDPEYWGTTLELMHPRDDGPPVPAGDRTFTLYSQYFGAKPISSWSDEFDDRMLARRPRATPHAPGRHLPWTRAEFDQEVRATLRSWRRPDLLADSRMTQSRMAGEAAADDPVAGLRRAFTAALETLRQDPRQAKYHRVLVATFVQGAPTQEAAAERLDLPYSTYRRHLARGLDGLCALLWKAETHGISLLDHEDGRHA